MARYVEDLELALPIICGTDGRITQYSGLPNTTSGSRGPPNTRCPRSYLGCLLRPGPDEATQAAAWRLLEAGDTLGISQVESTGFRMLLKRAKDLAELQSQHGQALRSVEDLAQLLTLWKPGVYGKEAEEAYFDARFAARERPSYAHAAIAKVLDSTHGQVLYAVM